MERRLEDTKAPAQMVFAEDVESLADWLVRVFGFIERDALSAPPPPYVSAEETPRSAAVDLLTPSILEIWVREGEEKSYEDEQGRPILKCVGMEVDSVDPLIVRVREAGIACEPPREHASGERVFVVQDPVGHQWQFIQRAVDPL